MPLAAGATILLVRRPRTVLGPLLGSIAILFAVGRAADAAVALDVSHGGSQFAGWRVNLTALAMLPAATLAITFGTLLLPDGHLPSRRWRAVAWASGAAITAYVVGVTQLLPDPISNGFGAIGWFGVLACATAGLGAIVTRWLRGRRAERAALAVVLGAGALPTIALLSITALGEEDSTALALPWLVCFAVLLPGSIVVAALVSEPQTPPPLARWLVLKALAIGGAVLGMVLAVFCGIVVGRTDLGLPGGVGAALLTLLALASPGRLARRHLARLLYGDRDTPDSLVRRLALRVRAGDAAAQALSGALADVRDGLRVPYAGVHTRDGAVLADCGTMTEPVHEILLADFGASPGYLVIGARSPGEPLTDADRELLAVLAPHIAAMANGALLVEELRRSRTGIVLAREEERRRLRRDLHDGLGAALSGIGYGLDAVALAAPDEAPERLRTVRAQLTGVQAELRRIIDDLRLSILDSAGLAEAVRADVRARTDGRVRIEADIAEPGPLPAGSSAVPRGLARPSPSCRSSWSAGCWRPPLCVGLASQPT